MRAKSLIFKSNTIKTLEEILKEAKVNLDLWEVVNYRVNKWDVSSRTAKRNGWNTTELWQVKVDLRPRTKFNLLEVVEKIASKIPSPKQYKLVKPKASYKCMLEMSLFDVHFGKLAWGLETGTNYDSNIASKVFAESVYNLLDKSLTFGIEKIIFPIGQDFFNCDNWTNTTNKGTPQDVDTRFQKIFETGFQALVKSIDMCLNVAPVELLWVPGNHDMETSWYLIKVLQAYYKNVTQLQVDPGPAIRKYKIYGNNLIGFTHGNEEKFADLPGIMAAEVPNLWAHSDFRVWHVGHYHKRKEIHYTRSDTFNGVRVEILPSLSGTDKWHYAKGYVKNTRAAEGHIYSYDDGPVGYLSTNVRDYL